MAHIAYSGFAGENRALHPLLLPAAVGTVSLNQKPGHGDLRPWKAPLPVASVPAGRQTIYRMGRDVASDTQYWLSWPTEVHAVRGFNAQDAAERTYYTGDGTPKWTDTTRALASAPYPTAARELGVPAPATPVILAASGGASTTVETRFYVYTYVTDAGEESAPSPVSLQLDCKSDDAVDIGSFAAPPSGAYGITLLRIYRTQANSSGGADFFFLREIAIGSASTSDDGRELGEVLPTTTWLMPPADLTWLTGLWNGMLAGISGRSVRFCEAYTPYAWPIAYDALPPDSTPVALGVFGQSLVVLTTGNPLVVAGSSPDSMDQQPLDFLQACVAPRSVVSMGHGVAWASPDGLAYVGSGGARLLTEGVLTREDWQAMNPASVIGCMYEGRYFGFYTVGAEQKGFVIDPSNNAGIYFLDFGADAVYVDDLQDALFVLNGTQVRKWDAGAPLTTTARSKLHRLPKPTPAFACAEVRADAYPVGFKLYADGALKHTQSVTSVSPFRLPGGYYAQDIQIEIVTDKPVQAVALAHSMQELAEV